MKEVLIAIAVFLAIFMGFVAFAEDFTTLEVKESDKIKVDVDGLTAPKEISVTITRDFAQEIVEGKAELCDILIRVEMTTRELERLEKLRVEKFKEIQKIQREAKKALKVEDK